MVQVASSSVEPSIWIGTGMALLAVEDGEADHQQNHDREADQADQDHEEIQRVHLRRDLRRLRRKEREVRHPLDEKLPDYWTDLVHSVIRSPFCLSPSSLVPLSGVPFVACVVVMGVAAEHDEHESAQQQHRERAAQLHHPGHDQRVRVGLRDRSGSSRSECCRPASRCDWTSLVQTQQQILGRVLDAHVVLRQLAFGRHDLNGAGVRKLVSLLSGPGS